MTKSEIIEWIDFLESSLQQNKITPKEKKEAQEKIKQLKEELEEIEEEE
ncbi:MAG: hypothetical protein JXQ77_01255 [Campylobacterales bacterium]|nr:hypothetical protein [Campylobacterales bacterium]